MILRVLVSLILGSLVSCQESSNQSSGSEATSVSNRYETAFSKRKKWCPDGYHLSNGMCANKSIALGPIPKELADKCAAEFPDLANVCTSHLPIGAIASRGNEVCPPGTTVHNESFCKGKTKEGEVYYGPFSKDQVARCRFDFPDNAACKTMLWQKSLGDAVQDKLNKEKSLSLSICKHRWEDKSGYADYSTLQKSPVLQTFDIRDSDKHINGKICTNARILHHCFEKSLSYDSKSEGGKKLLPWLKSKGIDPTLLKMAIASQETHLGYITDEGTNGRGLMQLARPVHIDGFDQYVALNGPGDIFDAAAEEIWRGIENNILSNIFYGSHMLGVKVKEGANSLKDLAEMYNGNTEPDENDKGRRPHYVVYGENVQKYYLELEKCGL